MIGILGAMELVGQILGPLIGGALTDGATWRWCFLVNVPSGAVAGTIVFFLLRGKQVQPWAEVLKELKDVDTIGILTIVPAVTVLLLVVQLGGTTYAWGSARIIAMIVLGAVLLVFLVWWEYRKGDKAAIPFRLFRGRSIPLAVLFGFSHGMAMAVFDYYVCLPPSPKPTSPRYLSLYASLFFQTENKKTS